MLILIFMLLSVSVYLLFYQFQKSKAGHKEARLPLEAWGNEDGLSPAKNLFLSKIMAEFKDKASWLPFPIPTAGLERKLLKGGLAMGAWEFLAFKLSALAFIPALSFIFLGNRFPKDLVIFISLGVGFLLPEIWLNSKIKKRQFSIRRDLPTIIDLLNLCVSGGLDFMMAVSRVVKDLKPCALTQELAEVYRETQMGKSRRDALKNFAWRVDMPEVHSFVRTLVQADRMGSPMAEALNMQSEEIRVRRFQHGEAMALKAPVKLLFPLFVFILPVVMVIVGGPIILQFVRGGMNVGF